VSRTALVTGADGLLGSHLVRKLLCQGFAVRAFLHPGSASPTLEGLPVERMAGDLTLDDGRLAEAVRGCAFVFHCAAVTDMWCPDRTVWEVNDGGTRRVVEACLAGGVERLVFTGSASTFQFGPMERPGDEGGPYPAAYRGIAYMESKHRATQRVPGELIRQFLQRGLRFTSPGGRCFAYAPDVADALVAAARKGRTGECYIAGGHNETYLEFFRRVAAAAGTARPPVANLPGAAVLAAGAAGSLLQRVTGKTVAINRTIARLSLLGTYYSSRKAVEELGMPCAPLGEAIEESIKSLRDYGYIK